MDLVHVKQLWVQLLRLIHLDAFITASFIIVYKNRNNIDVITETMGIK